MQCTIGVYGKKILIFFHPCKASFAEIQKVLEMKICTTYDELSWKNYRVNFVPEEAVQPIVFLGFIVTAAAIPRGISHYCYVPRARKRIRNDSSVASKGKLTGLQESNAGFFRKLRLCR